MDIRPVLAMYPALAASKITPLSGAGGFSGAIFWKLHVGGRDYCLRRWPAEHPTAAHLQWIHDVLSHVHDAAQDGGHVSLIPMPISSNQGRTFCEFGSHLWEASPWMPGRANFHDTQDEVAQRTKLGNAMTALASFHKSVATFQRTERRQPAPGMEMRLIRYESLRQGGADSLARCVDGYRGSLPTDIVQVAKELLCEFSRSPDIGQQLQAACQIEVSWQPCIRDIWHDHVLFTDKRVSGIVDFGAMRMAAVGGDVARLLGSLATDDRQLWEIGLEAYEAVNPFFGRSDTGRQLVRTWDAANVYLSGLQWVQWLFVDGRRFMAYETVHRRMTENLARLRYRTRRAGL